MYTLRSCRVRMRMFAHIALVLKTWTLADTYIGTHACLLPMVITPYFVSAEPSSDLRMQACTMPCN